MKSITTDIVTTIKICRKIVPHRFHYKRPDLVTLIIDTFNSYYRSFKHLAFFYMDYLYERTLFASNQNFDG